MGNCKYQSPENICLTGAVSGGICRKPCSHFEAVNEVIMVYVKHVYDEEPDLFGIFTCRIAEAMARDAFLKEKARIGLGKNEYRFTDVKVPLNGIV